MTTRFALHGLTHERLVDVVREGVAASAPNPRTDLSPSLYRRNPDVPALRIQTYPKRRTRSLDRPLEDSTPRDDGDPTYQDFLVADPTPGMGDLESA